MEIHFSAGRYPEPVDRQRKLGHDRAHHTDPNTATYMPHVHARPKHAPNRLAIEDEFRGALDDLWRRTAGSGKEHGGILREHRDTRALTFEIAPGTDRAHFTVDLAAPPDDTIAALAHTHLAGSSFCADDLAAQHCRRATVEYVRTAANLFAIVKSGEYWNRIAQLLAQFHGDGEELSKRICANFSLNFQEAASHFMRSYEPDRGETTEQVDELCVRFATRHAVRCYARASRAGYYEAAADAAILTRQA